MEWCTKKICHKKRKALGLSLIGWCYVDLVYHAQYSSRAKNGYCVDSFSFMADALEVGKTTLIDINKKCIKLGHIVTGKRGQRKVSESIEKEIYNNFHRSETDQTPVGNRPNNNRTRSETDQTSVGFRPNVGRKPTDTLYNDIIVEETTTTIVSENKIEEYKTELNNDQLFLESTMMVYKISDIQIQSFLNQFILQKRALGELNHKSYKEFKKHFYNWIPKRMSNDSNNKTTENRKCKVISEDTAREVWEIRRARRSEKSRVAV